MRRPVAMLETRALGAALLGEVGKNVIRSPMRRSAMSLHARARPRSAQYQLRCARTELYPHCCAAPDQRGVITARGWEEEAAASPARSIRADSATPNPQ